MMTFSLYVGSTQSNCLNLIGTSSVDLSSVLSLLPNNTTNQIQPVSIRSAILTSASSASFKQTKILNGREYIGVDTLNPSSRDVKNKIFIGKRTWNFTSTYNDNRSIMTASLLKDTSVDTFLYNTKIDTEDNTKTKISILAGTNSNIFRFSPYLQSDTVLVGKTQSLSFDFVNSSLLSSNDMGIKISSNSGTVSINNVVFPSTSESLGNISGLTAAGNGRVLLYNNGKLIWSDLVFSTPNIIGATGTNTNIIGSTIYLNSQEYFDFTDARGSVKNIGDIIVGNNFDHASIQELLKRIIYSYLPPLCSLQLNPPYDNGIIEVGTNPDITLTYEIEKRSLATKTTKLRSMLPGSYPPITSDNYQIINGVARAVIIEPALPITTTFSITVNDGTEYFSATQSVTACFPYFYGFSDLTEITSSELGNLNKLIEKKSNKSVELVGTGNLYFIYDINYGLLSDIKNQNGVSIFANFSQSIMQLSSPDGNWAAKDFYVYQWNSADDILPPSVYYTFNY